MKFMVDQRANIAAENPDCSPSEIVKMVAETWNSLPAKDKKPFLVAAEKDKEEYTKQMQSYVPPPEEVKVVAKPKKGEKAEAAAAKKAKDKDRLKRPLSSFMLFAADARKALKKEGAAMSPTETVQEIGLRWAGLSERAKAPYVQKAKEAREEYAKKVQAMEKPEE